MRFVTILLNNSSEALYKLYANYLNYSLATTELILACSFIYDLFGRVLRKFILIKK